MKSKTTAIMQISIAGFLSFLGTLSTAQAILYLLWLAGDLTPSYRLITGVISGLIGLFVGGWITTRVMDADDVWYSAVNGLLVGSASSYFLLGLNPLVLAVAGLSFIFAGFGGYAALRKNTQDSPETLAKD
ncbi:MAG: hypothetical protein MUP11_02870 [Anaerolineales bacterium]|nr:hypothetical protein [Anaerolineales bacterium]